VLSVVDQANVHTKSVMVLHNTAHLPALIFDMESDAAPESNNAPAAFLTALVSVLKAALSSTLVGKRLTFGYCLKVKRPNF
jgi:hypothetical protein